MKIGIPAKYIKVNNRDVMYVYDSVRRAFLNYDVDIHLIVPYQNISYIDTKYNDVPDLTNDELEKLYKELNSCDGLFMPGGLLFTKFDQYILDYAYKKDIPSLMICGSMQMMSCLHNKLRPVFIADSNINHKTDNHDIDIEKDTILYDIVKTDKMTVNSFHRCRALEDSDFVVSARSSDGVIEALEDPTKKFFVGLQWHPEKDYDENNYSKLIIDRFISEVERFAKKNDQL